jgi:phosphoglycolate phosphatase
MSQGTIIFDFDGTLADSFDLVLDLFYELTGHKHLTPEQITKFRQLSLLRAAKAVQLPPQQLPMLLIKGRTRMANRLGEVKPFHGMESALSSLQNSGQHMLVMSSNSQRNVEAFLKEHGLRQYFDEVYGGIGLLGKTRALKKVMRRNKLHAQDCFYVGDELRDMHAARRAHVRSVAVAWGYNDLAALKTEHPFATAKAPSDLVGIFNTTEADSGK